jgi:hypothetical protein
MAVAMDQALTDPMAATALMRTRKRKTTRVVVQVRKKGLKGLKGLKILELRLENC